MAQDREYFAEWLSRTLVERDIAGGEVARALGVNDSAISRWKNGKATPGLKSAMKLAEFLDVSPVALTVTAGLMDAEQAGVERLPMPKDTKTRNLVVEQLKGLRGLTTTEKEALITAYEDIRERSA